MRMLFIRLSYCLPSIVLYIVVVVLLYKEKKRLFGSFYFLLLAQAITNIFVFTNSFYLIQLANETDENSWWSVIYAEAPEFLIRFTICLGTHFAFVQTYMTFFISLNRMTFIVNPGMDEKIWKVCAPVCVLIAYLSPFAATYTYLTSSAKWVFTSEMHYFIVVIPESNRSDAWDQLFIFLCVFLALSSAVNIISVIFMCKRSTSIRSQQMERSMIILALLNFLIECSFFILFVLIYTSAHIGLDASVSSTLIPYASDILTLSNPYLIIALNRSIRSRLINSLKCKNVIYPWGIRMSAARSNGPREGVATSRASSTNFGIVNIV